MFKSTPKTHFFNLYFIDLYCTALRATCCWNSALEEINIITIITPGQVTLLEECKIDQLRITHHDFTRHINVGKIISNLIIQYLLLYCTIYFS